MAESLYIKQWRMAQSRTITAFKKFLKKVLTYVFDGGTMYLSVRDRQPTETNHIFHYKGDLTMKNNYPNITTKKAVLEVIEKLYNELDNLTTETTKTYKKVGVDETKQRTHWRTGELIWEDEEQTIPSYEPIYDYVDKTDEEMTDEDVATLDAIAVVRKALDKLV